VAVIDTAKMSVLRSLSVERPQGLGTSPVDVAVTPDGGRLLVAESGADALSVFKLSGAIAGGLTVRRVRSPATIGRYGARRRALTARYRQRRAQTHSAARRRTLKRRYAKDLRALRSHLLYGTSRKACAGPSRGQERRYVAAVLRAVRHRRAALAHIRGSGATARRQRVAAAPTSAGSARSPPHHSPWRYR
jgi:hypothetical protein